MCCLDIVYVLIDRNIDEINDVRQFDSKRSRNLKIVFLVKRKSISVADLFLKTLCVVNHLFSPTLYSHHLLLLL